MIVLAFHTHDHDTARNVIQDAKDVARHAQVVGRNGDLFTGWIERQVSRRPVVAVHAPHHPQIVAAYAAAGIPALEMPTTEQPVSDDAPVVIIDEPQANVPKRTRPRVVP